jgi:hypothetical protein
MRAFADKDAYKAALHRESKAEIPVELPSRVIYQKHATRCLQTI